MPKAARLAFAHFRDEDAGALGMLFGDPEIARTITANASTPEKRAACARKRIDWHNAAWETRGYGVWALRGKDHGGAESGRPIGWCGFAEPDARTNPEILYGLARDLWGRGLASEAAARRRSDFAGRDPAEFDGRARDAFRQGMQESHMDWYHLPHAAWQGT